VAAPTAAVALGSQKITGLGTPTAATDAATKAYADSRLGSVILASDYGVVADDSTDNAAALQAALDAAKGNNYVGGTTVLLPSGVVRLASGVHIYAGVSLVGVGAPGGTILRASGDGYFLVTLRTFSAGGGGGTRPCGVFNMGMDAVAAQTSGGGFNGTSNYGNVEVCGILFGSNLHTLVQAKPSSDGVGGGRYYVRDIRVTRLDAAGSATGITRGFVFDATSATNQAVAFFLVDSICAVNNTPLDWVTAQWVDTLHVVNCSFYQGAHGLVGLGPDATHRSTSARFIGCVFDSQTDYAINVDYGQSVTFSACQVISAVSTVNPAVTVGPHMQGFRWIGGMIARGQATGVLVKAGSTGTAFVGTQIIDNNRSNSGTGYGVKVEADATDFQFVGCDTGNRFYGGHQKRGIDVAAGASDRYVITGTTGALDADQTVTVSDAGTGTHKLVSNMP